MAIFVFFFKQPGQRKILGFLDLVKTGVEFSELVVLGDGAWPGGVTLGEQDEVGIEGGAGVVAGGAAGGVTRGGGGGVAAGGGRSAR